MSSSSRSGATAKQVRDYYRKILPFYELEALSHAHLSFWRGVARGANRVLEVGSGFGRITTELGRHASAVGIDLCLEMLSRAKRLAEAGPGRGSARFVAADLRESPFGAVFDLIVAPGDPLSHLTRLADRRRALRDVARLLIPGGRFVLEGLYRRPDATGAPRRTIVRTAGVLEIEEAWHPAGARQIWHARYRYRDRRPGEPDRTAEASFVARAWSPGRLRSLFAASGLTIEKICGDFDGRPFRRSSPRLVVFARRPRRRGSATRPRAR
jgi:SAM-dependent methyltransferase